MNPYCGGKKVVDMKIGDTCPNGGRPISGQHMWYIQMTDRYPALMFGLWLTEYELPFIFVLIVVRLLVNKVNFL